ncbi:hypothetical protein QFC21_006556 [Naganishia friedmannii]|uniref:Uncharacterized protein n=1 Tax=Naganishia friedmannii TaxID=89922 RepID=A0ACC2V1V5_9TREE|nr:hypothetical protein QFC21_006556 [Naganishia friedmannii]
MTDEPAYLRPKPPYVRSTINLLAWCVQIQKGAARTTSHTPGAVPLPSTRQKETSTPATVTTTDTIKITCFWNWNPHGTWAVGASIPLHLPALLVNLVEFVRSGQAEQIPCVAGYGSQISIYGVRYDPVRVLLGVDYAVVPEIKGSKTADVDGLSHEAEVKRKDAASERDQKSLVLEMSGAFSWDVQVRHQSRTTAEEESPDWTPRLSCSRPDPRSALSLGMLHLALVHREPTHENDLIRIHVTVERTSGNPGDVRLNGELMPMPLTVRPGGFTRADCLGLGLSPVDHLSPEQIQQGTETPQSEFSLDSSLVPDSVGGGGFKSRSRSTTLRSFSSMDVASHQLPSRVLVRSKRKTRGRSPAQEKSIGSLIKRNYIYFTSFLQEPDAKWRQITETKGVTVHHLNSIDPTLLVYRAEAVFVGVSLWDLWAILDNWGSRAVWDKSYEKADLLEHVNEMSELWHLVHRAGKSTAARDAVPLRTTYKSPDCIHIFGLSVDDKVLFPDLPASDEPHSIRQTIALQGWSLEKLSPNTVHVTLIEQVDPRGWSTKAAVQQAMITAVSGLGEHAIKIGAPPAIVRLEGAQLSHSQLITESRQLKVTYESATAWTTVSATMKSGSLPAYLVDGGESGVSTPAIDKGATRVMAIEDKSQSIECNIRCDTNKYWTSGIDIVVDPPPRSVTALHRHKLAESGGGLWVTINHDKTAVGSESVSLTLRAKSGDDKRDRFPLYVNGALVRVDTEELGETEIQSMKKQKRSKLTRRPLDQPPALPVLRRQATTSSVRDSETVDAPLGATPQLSPVVASNVWSRFSSPLTSIYSSAAQSSKNLFLAKPLSLAQNDLIQKTPIDALGHAFEQLLRIHVDRFSETTSSDAQWQQISRGPAGIVESKTLPFVSTDIPVYRSSRIIQNFNADDISAVIGSWSHRKVWDTKLMQSTTLQSYGEGVTVDWMSSSMAFPLRPRGFVVGNMTVKGDDVGTKSPLGSTSATPNASLTFHVSTSSFDRTNLMKRADRFNPQGYTVGNVILEGWILETLDPYSHDHYPVPSTRCMYVTAVDFGYLPLAANNLANAALPQRLNSLEKLLRHNSYSLPLLKTPKDRVLVDKEMLHARQQSSRGNYTVQRLSTKSILLQSQCSIDGSFECTIYMHPGSPSDTTSGTQFPQDWYQQEPLETLELKDPIPSTSPETDLGNSPPKRFGSRLLSATSGTLPRVSSPLSMNSSIKARRPIHASAATVCDLVFERSVGASFEISLVCTALDQENVEKPIILPLDVGLAKRPLDIHIEKAPAPVLRSAMNENDVYSIRVSDPSTVGLSSGHPLGDKAEDVSMMSDTGDTGTLPCVVRLALKRREVPGDHPFMMDGHPVEVRDIAHTPASPKPSAAEWPRLDRTTAHEEGRDCRVLACDVSLSGLDDGSASLKSGGADQSTAPTELEPSANRILSDRVSPPPVKSPPMPARPVRMNSIYRYLVQPVNLNRFSWPISGYPSPAVKPQDASALPLDAPHEESIQPVEANDTATASISPISGSGSEIVVLPVPTPQPILSTTMLLVLAIVLSFVLGAMSQRLLMHPEDFITVNPHPDLKLEDLRRLWQINVFGRHFILGLAV